MNNNIFLENTDDYLDFFDKIYYFEGNYNFLFDNNYQIHLYQIQNIVKYIAEGDTKFIYYKNINQNNDSLIEINNYHKIVDLIENNVKDYNILFHILLSIKIMVK